MTTIGCTVQLTAPAGSKTDCSALVGERGIERERCSRPHQTHAVVEDTQPATAGSADSVIGRQTKTEGFGRLDPRSYSQPKLRLR